MKQKDEVTGAIRPWYMVLGSWALEDISVGVRPCVPQIIGIVDNKVVMSKCD